MRRGSLTRLSILGTFLLTAATLVGCGGSENVVIEPGEDYQLTAQEVANKELEAKLRSEGS